MSVVKGMVGRTKKKSPTDVVRHLRETLTVMEKQNSSDKNSARIMEDFCKRLSQMKRILYGEGEHDPNPEAAVQLQNELLQNAMISRLISDMPLFEFESRKEVAAIINNLLHRESGGRNPTAEHIAEHPEIIELLFLGFENPEIALIYGSILRECLKHQQLAKILLHSSSFYKFFTFVEVSNFDIASDAFSTFKDLLSNHREISAEVLEKNFDQVFTAYKELLSSSNYVTRRLSVKLLGELLLDRTHFNIMTRYISDPKNLKLMMTLLRDKSKSIQFEAFHVFKVFVANPNKPEPIMDILLTNQSRLINFLTNFQTDKEADDEQFRDEKAFLIKQIEQLKK